MASYKSLNLDKQKGLMIEQNAENTRYEYYENGNMKSSSVVNPETGEIQNITMYLSETNFTKDLMETIIYYGSRKTHTYTDLQTGKIISSQTYDSKKRLTDNSTYDKETGYLTSSVSYNPETGKPLLENKYNPQIDGQLLSMTITDDRFPQKHFLYKYNDDNRG